GRILLIPGLQGTSRAMARPKNTRSNASKEAEKAARAARLVQARREAGYTGAQSAAEAHGWNVNNYKAHESGRNGFNAADARRYAAAYGVRVAWLTLNEQPVRDPGVVPVGREFSPDPDPDRPMTIGDTTGFRGAPEGAVPQ